MITINNRLESPNDGWGCCCGCVLVLLMAVAALLVIIVAGYLLAVAYAALPDTFGVLPMLGL